VSGEVLTGGITLLRPQIFAFFTLGILITLSGNIGFVPSWFLVIFFVGTMIALRQWVDPNIASSFSVEVTSYLSRAAISLLIWRMAVDIWEKSGTLMRMAIYIEAHIFTIFCSHMIAVSFFGLVASAAGINETSNIYPVLFISQLPFIVIFGICVSLIGQKYLPNTFAVILGKKGIW